MLVFVQFGNRLVETRFKYSRPLSKPLLSEQHERYRLNCAQSVKNYDWNKIILSDENNYSSECCSKIFLAMAW